MLKGFRKDKYFTAITVCLKLQHHESASSEKWGEIPSAKVNSVFFTITVCVWVHPHSHTAIEECPFTGWISAQVHALNQVWPNLIISSKLVFYALVPT